MHWSSPPSSKCNPRVQGTLRAGTTTTSTPRWKLSTTLTVSPTSPSRADTTPTCCSAGPMTCRPGSCTEVDAKGAALEERKKNNPDGWWYQTTGKEAPGNESLIVRSERPCEHPGDLGFRDWILVTEMSSVASLRASGKWKAGRREASRQQVPNSATTVPKWSSRWPGMCPLVAFLATFQPTLLLNIWTFKVISSKKCIKTVDEIVAVIPNDC